MTAERSNQKRWIYWLLIVGTLVASGASIVFYVSQFAGNGLSNDSGAWADFGAYLSGTVGVAAVTFTLFALILTLRQQDSIIEAQEEQIAKLDSHQRKIEAYSRAEKFFPVLRDSMVGRLRRCASPWLNECGYEVTTSEHVFECSTFGEIIRDAEFCLDLDNTDIKYIAAIANESVWKLFRVLIFVTECIEDAPELYDYFHHQLSEEWGMVRCIHAFHKKVRPAEYYRIAPALGLPIEYENLGGSEAMWQRIGSRWSVI